VPEIILSTEDEPAHGVSAVKALNIAATEGQRIFSITRDTIDRLATITIDSDTRAEVQGALLAGKEVIVHENPINESGWTGTGYIIFDPATGSGAFKISGGANGAFLSGLSFGVVFMSLSIIVGGALTAASGGILLIPAIELAIASTAAILVPLFKYHMKYYGNDPDLFACWAHGMAYGITACGVFGAAYAKLVVDAIIGSLVAIGAETFTRAWGHTASCFK
jgi:hypothetical protein